MILECKDKIKLCLFRDIWLFYMLYIVVEFREYIYIKEIVCIFKVYIEYWKGSIYKLFFVVVYF